MDHSPNGTAPADPPAGHDAHGRAALLLTESLIHGLTARSVVSVAEAVAIIEIALDAQIAISAAAVESTPGMRKAATLLSALAASLRIDLPDQADGGAADPI